MANLDQAIHGGLGGRRTLSPFGPEALFLHVLRNKVVKLLTSCAGFLLPKRWVKSQFAHHPRNFPLFLSCLEIHSAQRAGTRTKKPRRSGAKSVHRGLPI